MKFKNFKITPIILYLNKKKQKLETMADPVS